jgi:hypothetical protein
MKILTSTFNPFVNIAVNIANSKTDFDNSSFALIDFLLENQKFQYFDINETFLVNDPNKFIPYNISSNSKNFFTNFFNTVFSIEGSFNPQLINKLVTHGLIFDPFYRNENNEIIGDIVFSKPELNTNRNIFLLNLYLQQNGIENFTKNIVKFNTLNLAVSLNKLDLVKFILNYVSVNLTNEKLETPIMYANNIDTLNFLSSYKPYWGQKNIFGKDCSFFFSNINNKKIKQDLLDYFFKQLSQNTQINDNNNIEKKLEEGLVNLVTQNATKEEIKLFLKKYNLKNIDSITNKDNRTLGHICVNEERFNIFELFPNTDLYHIDNNGYNIFTSLFFKNNFSSSKKFIKAKELLLNCLKQPENNINQKNIDRLIEKPLQPYISNPLPDWILKDPLLRIGTFKALEISPNEFDFDFYNNKAYSIIDKSKLYFDLFTKQILKYDLKILQDNNFINYMFFKNNPLNNQEYLFDHNIAEILFLLLEKCEKLGKINFNEFLTDKFSNINKLLFNFKDNLMIYNKEIYETVEDLKHANNRKFYQEVCKPFFKFLNDKNYYSIIELIDEELVNETIKIDLKGHLNDFLKTFTYLKLNKKLHGKNIKNKIIKI